MKHKLLSLLFASLLSFSTASAQTDSAAYEVTGNMPVFYQQMKQQLTYPLAWGKAEKKDFAKWKAQARHVLAECMQNLQPAPKAYAMEVTDREQHDGYEARKIRFNLSEWSRVPAYLLVPEGKGPFPAIVLLHDHGAHFSIGKEKMVRPFHVAPEVMEDADQWASQCYDGQYVGDYLARHGYVVLAVDALFGENAGARKGQATMPNRLWRPTSCRWVLRGAPSSTWTTCEAPSSWPPCPL